MKNRSARHGYAQLEADVCCVPCHENIATNAMIDGIAKSIVRSELRFHPCPKGYVQSHHTAFAPDAP